jgi:transcriptional regulator with XRE-family HTH domain
MTIGERVRDFRKKHLLTLRDAEKIFGVSRGEISRIESEKNKPHFITEAKWEKLLDEAEKKGGL